MTTVASAASETALRKNDGEERNNLQCNRDVVPIFRVSGDSGTKLLPLRKCKTAGIMRDDDGCVSCSRDSAATKTKAKTETTPDANEMWFQFCVLAAILEPRFVRSGNVKQP